MIYKNIFKHFSSGEFDQTPYSFHHNAYMHGGGGRFRPPPPKPAKNCIGWVEKRDKKLRKGENQEKIGKIRLKIEKRGKSSNLA